MNTKKINFTIYSLLFLLLLGACNPKTNPNIYQPDTTEVSNQYPEDATVVEMIEPFKEKLDAKMDRVIGYFQHDMYKKLPEGELGNFMCDAPMAYLKENRKDIAPVDFCLMNFGGIRIPQISAGDVTVEKMFELMPFENELVIVELTGDTLKAAMARVANKGGWPISKDVNLLIENNTISQFLLNGEPVDYNKTYRVLVSDYVANGGDGMEMLEPLEKEEVGILLRDALIGYCEMMTERREPITARINGRIIVTK